MSASTPKKTPAAQSTRQQLDELDALLQKMLALPVNPADDPVEEPTTPTPEPRKPESPVLPRRVSLKPTQKPDPTPEPEPEPTPAPTLGPRLVQADTVLPVRELNPNPDEEAPEEWVPLRGGWQPSSQTWGPLAEAYKQQQGEKESPEDEPGTVRETVRIPVPTQTAPPTPTPTPTPPPAEVPESSVEAMARLDAVRQTAEAMAAPDAATPAPEPTPGQRTSLVLLPVVVLNRVYDLTTYPLGPLGRWLRGGGRGLLAVLGGLGFLASAGLLVLDWFDWTF